MRVLLVLAENRAVCESLRASLPGTDLLLFEATIEAAERRLVSVQADVVLLDDGPAPIAEAVSRIKAVAPSLPVVVLSAKGDPLTQAALTRTGAAQVIVKPFSHADLCAALDEAGGPSAIPTAPPAGAAPAAPDFTIPSPTLGTALGKHQMALRWLGRASAYSHHPLRLSQSLVESAVDIFDAVRCAVVLDSEDGIRIAASCGLPDSVAGALQLSYRSGLMRWFDEHACLFDRAAGPFAPGAAEQQLAAAAAKEMQVLDAWLATPLLQNGRVFGAILLGAKASGLPYSTEERELLTLVARSTSFAFERAGTQAAAIRHKQHVDRLLDNIHQGVITVLPDRTVGMLNPRAAELLGLCREDCLGKSVQKIGSALADAALRVLAGGETQEGLEIPCPATGVTLTVDAAPMEREGVVLSFSPILEERVAAQDVAHSPFWGYLSQRLAQEIKNPMVAISTFAQLLPRKYDSEDFRDTFSEVVQQEVARINSVVETLFGFAEDPKLTLRACDVNETVRNVLRSFEEELAKRAIEVDVSLELDAIEAEIDPFFFEQAVHNVVQNAVDAMPEGGKLHVATQRGNKELEISVADTGPGIPAEDAEMVFQPFFSRRERGMGLGLSTANRILDQHHGALDLVDDYEGGTCFKIKLPTFLGGDSEGAESPASATTAKESEDADDPGG